MSRFDLPEYKEGWAEVEGKALVKIWLENEIIEHETYIIGAGLASSYYETPPVEWGYGYTNWNFEPEDFWLEFPEDYEGLIKYEILTPKHKIEWDFFNSYIDENVYIDCEVA